MHDIVDLENRGVAGVFVATTEFIDGADVQAKALGANPAAVFVQHPIQDRTDDEIVALAETAVENLLAQITA